MSARAHLSSKDDGLATVGPLLDRAEDFAGFLGAEPDEAAVAAFRRAYSRGRPVGRRIGSRPWRRSRNARWRQDGGT